MKILSVDIGTGTQDIFLYDSSLDIENGFKLVLPSPTMMVHRQIKQATTRGEAILLTGVMMGGGPSAWAVQAHLRLGAPVYATPEAARTFDDDLERVAGMGVQIVSEDEADRLPSDVRRLEFKDFDFPAIAAVFQRFGVALDDLAAVAVAVFDHGAAPPGVSDRQFRFDYLDERIRVSNRLSAFAFLAPDGPASMTRLQAVAATAGGLDVPLVLMDTAPAAVLGATFDPRVARLERKLIANVGNFHTLAFRLGPAGIEGLFEHHTGELDLPGLEDLLRRLADGTLSHAQVFAGHGHGALIYDPLPFPLGGGDFDIVVTGPRRSLLRAGGLRPYFAVPFGDMMIAGCFGLLAATGDLLPELAGPIGESLGGKHPGGAAPWDV
ncbi:MAG: DUF1786 domain-containing protein [Chloroflexota bacterium]